MGESLKRAAEKALRIGPADKDKKPDGHKDGTVVSINQDGSYMVAFDDASEPIKCRALCTAYIGDRVLVVIKANGQCDAIGRVGGEPKAGSIHSGEKDGWYWEKWDNGKYVCWKDVVLSVTGWSQWGSIYEGAQYIESQGYPFVFHEAPAFEAKLIGGNSTGAYIAGFEIGYQGTASKSPAVTVLRGTSIDITAFTVRIKAEGFWKEPDFTDINGGGSSSGGGAGGGSCDCSGTGMFAMEVDAEGNLYVVYDGDEPEFELDSDGNLYYVIEE